MRKELHALVIIADLVVIALIGYYAWTTSPPNIGTTPSGQMACTTPVKGNTDVFEIGPGSTGLICVAYHFDSVGLWSFGAPGYGPVIYNESVRSYSDCSVPYGKAAIALCSSFKIVSSTGTVFHATGENLTVAYALSAGMNATGLFWFFIAPCDPIAVVVGAFPAHIPPPELSCVATTGNPSGESVTGVSGIETATVPYG